MGSLVDTGLGWYLDNDYLRTVGNTVMGTVETSGGSGEPLSPNTQYTDTDTATINVANAGGTHLNIRFSNVNSRVYWMWLWLDGSPMWPGQAAWCIAAISDQPFSMWMEGWGTYNASKPASDYYTYLSLLPGMTSWNDVYGVAIGWHLNFQSGSYNYDPNYNWSSVAQDFHDSVTQSQSVTHTVKKVQGGAGAFSIVSYPHDGETVYVGVGISSIPIPNSAATVAVDDVNGSYNTFNREGMQFTMFYTEPLTGTLTSNVPVVALDTDISGLPGVYEPRLFLAVANAAQIHVGFVPADEDPYAGGGTSEPGGGDGAFDNTSDQIDDSTTPVFSFAGSGFCRIYNPNLSQLQSLANYLWTDTTFLQTIINHAKQLLEDPIEAIISLAMLPVSIPQGTAETVKVLFISTQVSMSPATTQYVEVDCGTYTLEEYYGSALDYNPYTQVDLFLPFIGQVSLNTDEVMGHTIGVKYRVDIVSGLCVAKVFVDNDCMYQFSGNCAIFMPLNSADFSSYLSAAMTAATALVSAGAGMAAGAAAAGAEAVTEPAIQTGGNLLTSGESLVTPQMALQYRVEESVRPMYTPSESSPSASLGEMERKFINNSAAAVMGSKISFEHASHLAGNSGILGVRRPYLIINRPDMCNPEKYGKYNGRPCMMHLYLGNLTGYTEIQEIQLTGFSATNPELAEISKMLKGGVIF